MTRAEHGKDPRPAGWLEALHNSIALRSGAELSLNDPSGFHHEELDEVRECLALLERARQAQATAPITPRRVGRFEIVREIGRGGFGVVFEAHDPHVTRQVALKIPRPEVLVNPAARVRFLREGKAAGVLAHPNLIPVFEVGEAGPLCYIASAFCAGPNLAQWLKEPHPPVDERDAARFIEALARGVDHAHRRGVLHRDVKPSNILLEHLGTGSDVEATPRTLGNVTPRLTDFGLAKIAQSDEDETREGVLLGTPAYMAPEQAEGRMAEISPATDVYSLGVVLFELLAGVPPYRGDSDVQTLQRVVLGDAPRLASFQRRVPVDLEAIALKCLERSPRRRYSTADALAADLHRFLSGEPTVARPAGAAERLLKWSKRRPATAALVVVLLAATAALAGGGWWHSTQLQKTLDQLQVQKQETDNHLYATSVALADQELKNHNPERAREQLTKWIPERGAPDQRSFAWHHLWRRLHQNEIRLSGHTGDVYCVEYSPDGLRLATSSQDHTARIWNARTGECLHVLIGHARDVNCVAWRANGQQVATASDDGTICVWNASTGQLARTIDAAHGPACGVAFSPDGTALATCGRGKEIKLWNADSGELLATLTGHTRPLGAVAFSPSGKLLVSVGEDQTAVIWDVSTFEQVGRFTRDSAINSVAFSSDETRLLTSQRAGKTVDLFDLTSQSHLRTTSEHYQPVHAVRFHPTNEFYAVATKDGAVELINPESGAVLRRLPGHEARVWSLSFSSDGQHLASSSGDRTVKIWNLKQNDCEVLELSTAGVSPKTMTPIGQVIAVAGFDGQVTVFDVATHCAMWSDEIDFEIVGHFDGDQKVDSGYYHSGVWHLQCTEDASAGQSGERVLQFGSIGDLPIVGDWDGDGRDNIGYYRAATLELALDLDGQGGTTEVTRKLPDNPNSPRQVPVVGRWGDEPCDYPGVAAYHPPHNAWSFRFAQADNFRFLTVVAHNAYNWVPLSGRQLTGSAKGWGFYQNKKFWIRRLPTDGWVEDKKSPQNLVHDRWLSTEFKGPKGLPASTKALIAAHDLMRTPLLAMAIAPQGDRIAMVLESDPRVRVRELPSGRRVALLRDGKSLPTVVAFDREGASLAVGTRDGAVILYDATTYKKTGAFRPHDLAVSKIVFADQGRRLVSVDERHNVAVVDVAAGRTCRIQSDQANEVGSVAISHDRKLVAVGGASPVVGVYRADTGEHIASLVGHRQRVTGIAFSPDGRTIATCGADTLVTLWDTATWQDITSWTDGVTAYDEVSFSADGETLIAARRQKEMVTITRWSASPDDNAGRDRTDRPKKMRPSTL